MNMKNSLFPIAALLCLAATPPFTHAAGLLERAEQAIESTVSPSAADVAKEREQVRKEVRDSLARLYQLVPGARKAVEQSAGYAVFSTFGVKVLVAGGTSGKGLALEQRTRRETFMRMVQVQGGLGFGINQNRLIFVFATPEALNAFINQGWEFGAQANVSAMAKGEGGMFTGAAAVSPGVYLYQITENGLSATLTVAGTKFFKE
jgi:lipid-binding SYLF domain-containing protein